MTSTAPSAPAHQHWSRCRPDCDLAPLSPRHLFLRTPDLGAPAWPGLVVTAVATAAAFLVSRSLPYLNAATVAVVLGVLVTNVGLHRPALRPGTHVASHRLLRYLTPFLHLAALALNVALLDDGWVYALTLALQLALLGAALLGRLLPLPPFRVARYYVMTTASIAAGLWDRLTRGAPGAWEKAEGTR